MTDLIGLELPVIDAFTATGLIIVMLAAKNYPGYSHCMVKWQFLPTRLPWSRDWVEEEEYSPLTVSAKSSVFSPQQGITPPGFYTLALFVSAS